MRLHHNHTHQHRSYGRNASEQSARPTCQKPSVLLAARNASSLRTQAAPDAGVNPFATTAATASPAVASPAPAATPSTGTPGDEYPWSSHTWNWRGHTIHYKTAGCGEPILLVHGFGLSSFHYRRNIPVLAEKYKVYAIDLLGFGLSSKPIRQYSMELWRDQLLDFVAEFAGGKPVVLAGNSIGALACLMTSAALPAEAVRGTVLLNSAGAMNNKGVIGDWRILAVYPLLLFIDFLLSIPAVSAALFNGVRSKANIGQVLREGVYRNPASVDEALVDAIFAPSCDPGAREVFVSVITGPPGPKPWALMPDVKGPLLVLWGDRDTLTPADGPVGRFLKALPATRPETTFTMLEDVGHCLHDDRPELVHAQLLPWLERVMAGQPPCAAAAGEEGAAEAAAAASTAAAMAAARVDAQAEAPFPAEAEVATVAAAAAAAVTVAAATAAVVAAGPTETPAAEVVEVGEDDVVPQEGRSGEALPDSVGPQVETVEMAVVGAAEAAGEAAE